MTLHSLVGSSMRTNIGFESERVSPPRLASQMRRRALVTARSRCDAWRSDAGLVLGAWSAPGGLRCRWYLSIGRIITSRSSPFLLGLSLQQKPFLKGRSTGYKLLVYEMFSISCIVIVYYSTRRSCLAPRYKEPPFLSQRAPRDR